MKQGNDCFKTETNKQILEISSGELLVDWNELCCLTGPLWTRQDRSSVEDTELHLKFTSFIYSRETRHWYAEEEESLDRERQQTVKRQKSSRALSLYNYYPFIILKSYYFNGLLPKQRMQCVTFSTELSCSHKSTEIMTVDHTRRTQVECLCSSALQ